MRSSREDDAPHPNMVYFFKSCDILIVIHLPSELSMQQTNRIKTMSPKDQLLLEIEQTADPILEEVLDFLQFLKAKQM